MEFDPELKPGASDKPEPLIQIAGLMVSSSASSETLTVKKPILAKTLTFSFKAHDVEFSHMFKGRPFGGLSRELKLLLAVAQATYQPPNSTSAFKNEDHRRDYYLRIVNKGAQHQEDKLDDAGLQCLIDEVITRGCLAIGQDGIEITEAGAHCVRDSQEIRSANRKSFNQY